MAQRRHSPEVTRNLDRLAEIMRGVPRERVAAVLDRSVRVNFNVTPQQHEEIKSTADALGLNVTEYLRGFTISRVESFTGPDPVGGSGQRDRVDPA